MTEAQLRQKVVDTILGWVGLNEADGSHKKIVDIYNSHKPLARGYALKYTDAWCAGTVSAVAIVNNITDIMPTEVGVGKMIDLYKALGRWMERDDYTPQIGDVVVYAWSDNGVGECTTGADHVGIVIYHAQYGSDGENRDGETAAAEEGQQGQRCEGAANAADRWRLFLRLCRGRW